MMNLKNLLDSFKSRVIDFDKKKQMFFEDSYNSLLHNIISMNQLLKNSKNSYFYEPSFNNFRKEYLKNLRFYKMDEGVITNIELFNNKYSDFLLPNDKLILNLENESKLVTNIDSFRKSIKQNSIKKERFVFLPRSENLSEFEKNNKFKKS